MILQVMQVGCLEVWLIRPLRHLVEDQVAVYFHTLVDRRGEDSVFEQKMRGVEETEGLRISGSFGAYECSQKNSRDVKVGAMVADAAGVAVVMG